MKKIKSVLILLVGFVMNTAVAQQNQPEQIREMLNEKLNKSPKELYEIAVSKLAPEATAIFKHDPKINCMAASEQLLAQTFARLREQARSSHLERLRLQASFLEDKKRIEENSPDAKSEIKSLIDLYYPRIAKLKAIVIQATAHADEVDKRLAELRKELAFARRVRGAEALGVNPSESGIAVPTVLRGGAASWKQLTAPSTAARPASSGFANAAAAMAAMQKLFNDKD
jgi:hypothetical protein